MGTATGACDHWVLRSGEGRPPCSQDGNLLRSGKRLPRIAPNRKGFGFSSPKQTMLQGIDLEGVAGRRQEARTVRFPSCGGGGQQARDVANVPDVLRALDGGEVDVVQRKTTSGRTFSTDALKNHTSLLCHV